MQMQNMSWDNAPESIKLEFDNFKNSIMEMSQNRDISINSLKDDFPILQGCFTFDVL
jgi:hypothetical protein